MTTEKEENAEDTATDEAAANQQEQLEQDNDAALEAGFNAARTGEDVPVEPETPETTGEEDPEKDDPEKDGDDPEKDKGGGDEADDPSASPDQTETFTRDQVQEMVNQALSDYDAAVEEKLSKVHGKIGEFNRRLNEEKESARKPVELTKENLKHLSEDYDDLAEALAKDLSGVLMASGQEVDKEALTNEITEQLKGNLNESINSTVSAQVQEVRDQLNEGYLNFMSPGWEEKVNSDEYDAWLKTLPRSEQQQIEESEDPFFVAKTLERFDSWTTEQKAADDKAKQDKKKQLADAEPATKGGAAATSTSEDPAAALEAGFKSVRGG